MAEGYRARELYRMLDDPANLLYFTFLCPIVTEMEALNRKFQTSNPDMANLMEELNIHYQSVKIRGAIIWIIRFIFYLLLLPPSPPPILECNFKEF